LYITLGWVKVGFSVPYSSGHITAVKYDRHVGHAANSKKTRFLTSESSTYLPEKELFNTYINTTCTKCKQMEHGVTQRRIEMCWVIYVLDCTILAKMLFRNAYYNNKLKRIKINTY